MESQDDGVSRAAENCCEGCRNLFESDVFNPQETLRDWPATRQDFLRFSNLSDLAASASTCATCKYFLGVAESDELFHSQTSNEGGELVIAPSRAPYAVYRDNSPDAKVKCLWAYRIDITLEGDGITYARRGTPSILPLASSASSLFQARQIREAADLGLAQKWLSICKGCHEASCDPAEWKAIPGLQFRLVDVKRKCVVPAPVRSTYTALSYVWGNVKPLQLVKDNYDRLTTNDGLSTSQGDVPQVYLDAIKVSEALGFQYIWIDAICIQQDDEGDRTVQIENMRSIYSCASLTIVSDSSSAATGLPCLQRRSRTTSQMLYQHGQLRLTNVLPNLHHSLSYFQWRAEDRPWEANGPRVTSPWESRGWTFQEKIFSKRLLIFGAHQMFFQCNSTTWSEDTILEVNDPAASVKTFIDTTEAGATHNNFARHHPQGHLSIISKPELMLNQSTDNMTGQSLKLYADLLRKYTTRRLSNASDAINAFYGVLDLLSSSHGQHIYGLPEAFFHAAMLWEYDGKSKRTLERRAFPSWSWAAYESDSSISVYGAVSHVPNFGVQMYRCTSQGKFELVDASRREMRLYLAHSSSTSNDLSKEQMQELKNDVGWTNESDQFVTEQLQVFKKALKRTSWNPFRELSMTDLQYLKQIPPKAHVLRFWTTSAFLLVKSLEHYPRSYRAFNFPEECSAEDKSQPYNGERCSSFDSYSGLDTFELDPSWRDKQGRGLEFIILSNYTHFVADGPHQDPDATRLNAMLIERKDGIAYRVGTAVFKEREWIQAKPQWKLITLA